jgi:hypothetical protein
VYWEQVRKLSNILSRLSFRLKTCVGLSIAVAIFSFIIFWPNFSAALEKQSLGQQFPWLLNYVGKGGWQVVSDSRYEALIKAIVPNQPSHLFGSHFSLQKDFETVTGSVPDNALLKDGRYFIFDGFVPRDALQKGIVWLDLKSTDAAVAIVHYSAPNGKSSDKPMLYIASRTILVLQNMPLSFKAVLDNWLDREGIRPTIVSLNGVDVSKTIFK